MSSEGERWVAFVRARLDGKEAAAKAARWSYSHSVAEPDRALREVEFGRAVVASYQRSVAMVGEYLSVPDRRLVEAQAAIWSDHPDYAALVPWPAP